MLRTFPVQCGYHHSMILTAKGLYVNGSNSEYQLGVSRERETEKKFENALKVEIPNQRIVRVFTNFSYHSIVLTNLGLLYSTGSNTRGQCGFPKDKEKIKGFKLITFFKYMDIKDVVLGESCTFVHTKKNKVYAFGDNTNGTLALGCFNQNFTPPTEIKTSFEIEQVFCGKEHVFFKDIYSNFWGVGRGSNGRLGNNNRNNIHTPVLINYLNEKVLNISTVSCGGYHTMFYSDVTRKSYGCGYNEEGQLGLGNTNDYLIPTEISCMNNRDIVEVKCSFWSTCFRSKDNEFFLCGENSSSSLSIVSERRAVTIPIQLKKGNLNLIAYTGGWYTNFFVDGNGFIYVSGKGESGQLFQGKNNNLGPLTLVRNIPRVFLHQSDLFLTSFGKKIHGNRKNCDIVIKCND